MKAALPRVPYRGIESFAYSDHPIFFARRSETRALLRHVVVYRGVLLYGDSGSGKSSLVNAGLIPAAEEEGLRADRIRVQPRAGEEIVVERLWATADGDRYLPSSFTAEGDDAPRIVLSTETFAERLREPSRTARPLLIFDQFEELSTLFEEAAPSEVRNEALNAQRRIVQLIVDLLHDETRPLKLLLVFREDYLAKINQLLAARPELIDHSLRLARPPRATETLYEIIHGPFDKYPGHFRPELSEELAKRLAAAIESRSASGVSLSEVQIACLRLWESKEPERLFEEKGVQGLLEDFLSESLDQFPGELRDPAVAVLSHMVTAAGTRNVVSAEGLVAEVRGEEDIPEERVREALTALERDTRLVRRERRRDIDLYEIVSEFLLPWIRQRREERLADQAAKKERQRQKEARRRLAAIFAVILLLVLAGAAAIVANRNSRLTAERERVERAIELASVAVSESPVDPVSGVALATQAVKTQDTPTTRSALRATLSADHLDAVLRGHTEPVRRASFSPDGKLVVTASNDGTARIWNASTGKRLHVLTVLPLNGGHILYARFSADGEHVLTADASGRVRLWTRSGRPVRTLERFGSHLCHGPDLSPDGSLVLTCGSDGRYRVWKTATGQPVGVLPPLDSRPVAAALSPDGNRVLSATANKRVTIWNVAKRRPLRVLPVSGNTVTAASFSPYGGRVVIGTGLVATIWNLRTLRHVPLRGHTGKIESAAFSDGGRYVVTAAGDNTARIWDALTGDSVAILKGHDDYVLDGSFSPHGLRVVTSSSDRTARVWDVHSATGDVVLPTLGGRVYSAAFRLDDRKTVTAGSDAKARIWDARTGLLRRVLRSKKALLAAAYLPDGIGIVTAGLAGVEIWRPHGRPQPVVAAPARDVDVRSDGALLITGYYGSKLWIVQARHKRQRLRTHGVLSALFSAEGDKIITAGDRGVRIWDATTLAPAGHLQGAGGGIQFASFSPDGKLIATAGSDATARLWDTATGHEVRVLKGHGGAVRSARFSPDGRSVVTASDDRTVRIWNTANGALEAIFADHTDVVWSAAFSNDGMRIVTASNDGTARIYRLTPVDELLKLAQERLRASVTAEDEQSNAAKP